MGGRLWSGRCVLRPSGRGKLGEEIKDCRDHLDETIRVHRVHDELADRKERRVLFPYSRALETVDTHDEEGNGALTFLSQWIGVNLIVRVFLDLEVSSNVLEIEEHTERFPERKHLPHLLHDVFGPTRARLTEAEELGKGGDALEARTKEDGLLVDTRGRRCSLVQQASSIWNDWTSYRRARRSGSVSNRWGRSPRRARGDEGRSRGVRGVVLLFWSSE